MSCTNNNSFLFLKRAIELVTFGAALIIVVSSLWSSSSSPSSPASSIESTGTGNNHLTRNLITKESNALTETEGIAEKEKSDELQHHRHLKLDNKPPRPLDKTWCPDAVCQNSRMCHPCNRRFLFVIATSRSAATTLTYMLDSLPGIRMAAANGAILNQLQTLIDTSIRNQKGWQNGAGHRGPWGHNVVPPGGFSCAAQSILETMNPPDIFNGEVDGGTTEDKKTKKEREQELSEDYDSEMILGFKATRFLATGEEENDEALIRFVQEMFPCARFILNYRSDVEAQMASFEKNLQHTKVDTDELHMRNDRMMQLHSMLGPHQSHIMDSSKWTDQTKSEYSFLHTLDGMAKWLGYSEGCKFPKLLEYNTNGYNGDLEPLDLGPECYYLADYESA